MTTTVSDYSTLAPVYDRWLGSMAYERMLGFVERHLPAGLDGASVVDLCCGTGTMALLLAARGARVIGIDASPEMLAVAAERLAAKEPWLGPRPVFRQGDAAAADVPAGAADLVLCTFDSLNYFPADGFAALARGTHASLRPGGRFIGDVNTPFKLGTLFGNSTYAEDQGDYAYTWRNRLGDGWIDFEIHLRRFEGTERRPVETVEHHRQYLHEPAEVARWLEAAGFAPPVLVDDYGDAPPGPETQRIAFVAERPA